VQRVTSNGFEIVQSLVDQGSGWEAYFTTLRDLPDTVLAGVAVTAHDDGWAVQAYANNVEYDTAPSLIGITTADPLAEACGDQAGLNIMCAKMPAGWTYWDEDGNNDDDTEYGYDDRYWAYLQAEHLAKNNGFSNYFGAGDYYEAEEYGSRVDAVVNLADDGATWTFPDDKCFPGVDDWVDPADDTDNDEQFAVVVQGCIELTEGLHVLGGGFDDGVLLRIGGVEIGRTGSWSETGQWFFMAEEAGIYSLEAVGFEMGGGAFLELYEWLPDGTQVLLGDVANGASAVYCVPEPATIGLLGMGLFGLIRRKR
jgi:hypothetical protein